MEIKPIRIAVLLTCHNRKSKTLACLAALFNQNQTSEPVNLEVYLVDDGSTDGTSEAIKTEYPNVQLIQGDGNLFWNGGMRLAFAEAMKSEFDYYLWLNDDTLLYNNALQTLLETVQTLILNGEKPTLITGSTRDPETGVFTYGGVVRSNPFHPINYRMIPPTNQPQNCDTMNGNCVLISQAVVEKIGNLEPAFTHMAGDFDYGLRAKKQGFKVWIAPGYIGTCARNPQPKKEIETNLSLRELLQKQNTPKGYKWDERVVYYRRHAGFLWPIYLLYPYSKLVVKTLAAKLRKNHP